MDDFNFFSELSEIHYCSNAKIVLIKSNITDKKELFKSFNHELNLPSYFGENWDALYDCLTDLIWIKTKIILIIHEDIPFKPTSIEQNKYIELLYDVINSWRNSEIHELKIYFPDKFKKEIEWILINGANSFKNS